MAAESLATPISFQMLKKGQVLISYLQKHHESGQNGPDAHEVDGDVDRVMVVQLKVNTFNSLTNL